MLGTVPGLSFLFNAQTRDLARAFEVSKRSFEQQRDAFKLVLKRQPDLMLLLGY